jgi:hypothetical protein
MNVIVEEISVLSSPSGLRLEETIRSLGSQPHCSPRVTAEVGPAPAILHRLAADAPERWTHGAAGILLGPMADESLAEVLKTEKAQAWIEAFPGIRMFEVSL